jgi:hypothetical protein
MAIPVLLHRELDVLIDTIQVVKEVNQLAWTMWLDDEIAP